MKNNAKLQVQIFGSKGQQQYGQQQEQDFTCVCNELILPLSSKLP